MVCDVCWVFCWVIFECLNLWVLLGFAGALLVFLSNSELCRL
ncbi:hypothetical protein HanXRQr2_Chr07g0283221 [Helianthus annuus]|uniref:Uncharacterized protein n=1 Tax=Helianthus annuus TaxID=4232 RepID=A0A9K3IJN7_HELAN|nr:hypothetical protein HanXRQr2_Chr07g0283221 [Helianthus annuus]KAJ0903791.1 hypothetical protein HanPSC8_Chr07g0274071 [Helianthus annuus]